MHRSGMRGDSSPTCAADSAPRTPSYASYIGSCQMDLLSLVRGSPLVSLALRDRRGRPLAIRLAFTALVKLQVRDFSVRLSALHARLLPIDGGESVDVQVSSSLSGSSASDLRLPLITPGVSATESAFTLTGAVELVHKSACLRDLLFLPTHALARVSVICGGRHVGMAEIAYRDYYPLTLVSPPAESGPKRARTSPTVPFIVPVVLSTRIVGSLSGSIAFGPIPPLAQMRVSPDGAAALPLCPGLYGEEDGSPPLPPLEDPDSHVYASLPSAPLPCESGPAEVVECVGAPLPPHWRMHLHFPFPPPPLPVPRRPLFTDDRCPGPSTPTDPRLLPRGWTAQLSAKGQVQFTRNSLTTAVDPRACPRDWTMKLMAEAGGGASPYYCYAPTQQTTFTDPRGLPPHHAQAVDAEGRVYFKDSVRQETTWTDPREAQTPEERRDWRARERKQWWSEACREIRVAGRE